MDGDRPAEEPFRIKALSYNIHKGFSTANRKFVLEQMRKAIRQVHADLVFLQEVQGEHQGHGERIDAWPGSPQFEFLADSIWRHYAYGQNAAYDAGHHGNAILSKFPIVSSENVDISTNTLEKRGLLHGVLDIPTHNVQLHVICLHLNLLGKSRLRQVQQLCDRIETVVPDNAPLIIGGDFNDWRLRISDILAERLGLHEAHLHVHEQHARTFPSWMPILKLDRIYFRGFRAIHAESLSGAPWYSLSDHAAIYTELELVP